MISHNLFVILTRIELWVPNLQSQFQVVPLWSSGAIIGSTATTIDFGWRLPLMHKEASRVHSQADICLVRLNPLLGFWLCLKTLFERINSEDLKLLQLLPEDRELL